MVVVGYSDELGAFKVLNSWGEKWGTNGFGWISYLAFQQLVREAYVSQDYNFTPQEEQKLALTPGVLAAALRESISPQVLEVTASGAKVSQRAIWVELPPQLRNTVDHVEYYFNHPTFPYSPYRSQAGSGIFLHTWSGWGCTLSSDVVAYLKDGNTVRAHFDMCEVARRLR